MTVKPLRTPGQQRAARGGRGQALVELAITIPLLFLLLMGVIEVGRIVFTYIALEDAVHEGAVFASYDPTATAAIRARVTTSSNHDEVVNATVAAPVCTTTPAPGTVSLTATYDLPLLTPIGDVLFGGSFRMSATSIATNLKGTCS